jgi:CcmD family protein
MRRIICVILVVAALLPPAAAVVFAQQPGQPATEEFVPIDQLPVDEQLPAAPLLVAAYAVVWVGLLGYFWVMWRRLQKVEAELASIEARMSGRGERR